MIDKSSYLKDSKLTLLGANKNKGAASAYKSCFALIYYLFC
jgi:hypothetical protein